MARKCAFCGDAYEDAERLLLHINDVHALPSTSTAGPSTKKGPNECNVCAKKYSTRAGLLRHRRDAHSVKVQCVKCHKYFKNKRVLSLHKKAKHSGDCVVICDKCGGRFNRPYELRCHLRLRRCGSKRSTLAQRRKLVAAAASRNRLQCSKCDRSFNNIIQLLRHKQKHAVAPKARYVCVECHKVFPGVSARARHRLVCVKRRQRRDRYLALRQQNIRREEDAPPRAEWVTRTAIEGNARVHELDVSDSNDLQLTLIKNKDNIINVLTEDMETLRRIKWYMTAFIRLQRGEKEDEGDSNLRYMRCKPITSLLASDLEWQSKEAIQGVINSLDFAQEEGSKILFGHVEKIELRVAKYVALKGSSFIPLPEWLQKPKQGLVNIQNVDDNLCFKYCILAGIDLPRIHPERVAHYRGGRGRRVDINWDGIKFPMRVEQISKFENQNQNIAVTVFGLEEDRQIVPLRISKVSQRPHHIRLLLLMEEDTTHYVLIKDLGRFLSHLQRRKRQLFWCDNCLTSTDSQERRDEHYRLCMQHEAQAIQMPRPKQAVMKFKSVAHQTRHDFVIYCDLESIVVPYETALPDPSRSHSAQTATHQVCGYSYVIVGADGTLLKEPVLEHGGADLAKRLLLRLKEEKEAIDEARGPDYELDMTEETQKEFDKATHCYVCNQKIPREGVLKVRDHDHTVEKNNYRGAACSTCNLNLKRKTFVPVFFHNLTNYDSHILISAIGELSDGEDISVIPKTKERYISFTWEGLRFLDSYNFLSSPLDKLVNDLEPDDLSILKEIFPKEEQWGLLNRKGVYPYSYFCNEEKFLETSLPPRECFRNDLNGQDVSESDYAHAMNVFKTFKMEILWDYHDLYLLTDTLLLACVMETYRKATLHHFKLDVVYYYSGPGFCWDAALLYTGQELQLLTELSDHMKWERAIRGGVSSVNCRLIEANNPYIKDTYEPQKEHIYAMYLDANNLYGCAMTRALPVGDFRYLTRREIQELDIMNIDENDPTGYLFEVDLIYPSEIHDWHNDFPLAPEHVKVEFEHLSPLQKRLLELYDLPKRASTKKLIPNLYDKERYCVYGSTLKLYLSLGLELENIHSVMCFDQKPWLAPFINFNTEMRKQATSDFQKSLWKLYNNSTFGKTIESVRKRRNVNFTKQNDKFLKLVRSPLYHSFELFDHGLVAVERKKASIVLNRPVYTGAVILDISKEIMYNFYYNCLKKKYGNNVSVGVTDTDSLLLSIKTDDVYLDMFELLDHLDTSDYPPDHPLFNIKNKKVLGKFKDELNGVPLKAMVGLRAKMYSFQTANVEKCVAKGVPKTAVKSQITFQDYKDCLLNYSSKHVTFKKIGTDQKHHLFTLSCSKKALSCYDDKRYILGNNINTLAHGHYKIGLKDADEGAENLELLAGMIDEL